eukprot:9654159-Alexandrium_andersonii.AAC.1
MLRWITEIESDGSQLRNLNGRAAVLGDGLGRRFEAELAQSACALRTFDIEEFLDHCEEADKIQLGVLPNHA